MTERNDSPTAATVVDEELEATTQSEDGSDQDRPEQSQATGSTEEAQATEQTETTEQTGSTEQTGEVLVSVDGLIKHYGPIRAVDGISFEVRRGDILGFLGPNGAGKTTAMRLITGFLEPDGGRIEVGGHDLATDSLAARQKVGYLPENAPAYGEMTVTGFLEFIAEARGVENTGQAVVKVVGMTGLQKVQHQTIETLSKGFKRRVGLAQALIHDPEVLILDEPTDGLDPNQKAMVMKLIANLSAEKCIILSTHILDEVERICNRAMIISQGKILVDAKPEELIAQAPSHNMIRLSLQRENAELFQQIADQPWCERTQRHSPVRVDVFPVAGGNHLADLLAVVKDEPIQSIHLQEGRLTELFRQVTEGIAT